MQERVLATNPDSPPSVASEQRANTLRSARIGKFKALFAAAGTCALTSAAFAQVAPVEPTPAPPMVTADVSAAPPAAPLPPPPPVEPPPPAPIVEEPRPLAESEPEPVEKPKPEAPKLKIGLGMRTGLAVSHNEGSKEVDVSLNDGLVDQVHFRPYFSGQLTDRVTVVGNFEVGTPNGLGVFHVLDAIAQIKFFDELQLWVGQHIPANDRTNFSGPFYHNSWNFAIAVPSYPFDTGARDRGFTLWGLVAKGILKYHASVVDLQPGNSIENSRLAGRVTINLLDPENYYYSSGTYYGAQDTLAIGAVVQYQNGIKSNGAFSPLDRDGNGKVDNDFLAFSFDLLAEKNFHEAGTFTLEGGYWNFNGVGKEYVVNQSNKDFGLGVVGPAPGQSFLVAASWLPPKRVGPGFIQPNARFQYGNYTDQWVAATSSYVDTKLKVVDAGLAYVVDGFNHRWNLNYRHSDTNGVKGDMGQLGVQFQL